MSLCFIINNKIFIFNSKDLGNTKIDSIRLNIFFLYFRESRTTLI